MKGKKIISAALAGVMALSLTACGGGSAQETTAAPAAGSKAEETTAAAEGSEAATRANALYRLLTQTVRSLRYKLTTPALSRSTVCLRRRVVR